MAFGLGHEEKKAQRQETEQYHPPPPPVTPANPLDQLRPDDIAIFSALDSLTKEGTYSDKEWAFIKEPLQNALDSFYYGEEGIVEREEYKITLTLDPKENTITIQDNGMGWPRSTIKALYRQNVGDKQSAGNTPTARRQKGSQGLGVKATLFQSRKLMVQARNGEDSWQIELSDFCDYSNTTEWIQSNLVPDIETRVDEGTLTEEGTIVTITPPDDRWVAEYLKGTVIDGNISQIKGIPQGKITDDDRKKQGDLSEAVTIRLLNHSYLADLMFVNPEEADLPEIKFEVVVAKHRIEGLLESRSSKNTTVTAGPHPFKKYYESIPQRERNTLNLQTDPIEALREGVRANHQILTAYVTKEQLKLLLRGLNKVPREEKWTIKENEDEADPSSLALVDEKVNGMQILLVRSAERKKYFNVAPRLALAAHGLITSSQLTLQGNAINRIAGYQQGTWLALDVKEDLGPQKENLRGAAKAQYNSLISDLFEKSLGTLLRVILGEQTETSREDYEREEIDIGAIPEPDPIYDLDMIGMANEPQTENDVIFAFGHYLARLGDDRPIRLRQSNQRTHIDAAALIDNADIPSNAGKALNIEYKKNMKEYLNSIEAQPPSDFDVLVVWENDCISQDFNNVDASWKPYGEIRASGRKRVNLFREGFVGYRLMHRRSAVGVVVLSELVSLENTTPDVSELQNRPAGFTSGGPPTWQHESLEGVLARSGRPAYPKTDDITKEEVDEWIEQVESLGIKTILTILSKEGEDQLTCYEEALGETLTDYVGGRGLSVHHVDYPDTHGPVSEERIEEILGAFEAMEKPVLVHCSAGIDRTGSVLEAIIREHHELLFQ